MALVRSISNHPYGSSMRHVGAVYETDTDEDAQLLESLKRVVRVSDKEREALEKAKSKEGRQYETRELQARPAGGGAGIMTTSGVAQPAAPAPAAPTRRPSGKSGEPSDK